MLPRLQPGSQPSTRGLSIRVCGGTESGLTSNPTLLNSHLLRAIAGSCSPRCFSGPSMARRAPRAAGIYHSHPPYPVAGLPRPDLSNAIPTFGARSSLVSPGPDAWHSRRSRRPGISNAIHQLCAPDRRGHDLDARARTPRPSSLAAPTAIPAPEPTPPDSTGMSSPVT